MMTWKRAFGHNLLADWLPAFLTTNLSQNLQKCKIVLLLLRSSQNLLFFLNIFCFFEICAIFGRQDVTLVARVLIKLVRRCFNSSSSRTFHQTLQNVSVTIPSHPFFCSDTRSYPALYPSIHPHTHSPMHPSISSPIN